MFSNILEKQHVREDYQKSYINMQISREQKTCVNQNMAINNEQRTRVSTYFNHTITTRMIITHSNVRNKAYKIKCQ